MLDPRDVVRLAPGVGMERFAEALAALARPAHRLVRRIDGRATRSRVGGVPDLEADTWPVGRHGASAGRPMAFVLQLDLAELAPDVWAGPRSGLLGVFCGYDPDVEALWDEDRVRVLVYDDEATAAEGMHHGGGQASQGPVPLRAVAELSVPTSVVALPIGLRAGFSEAELEELGPDESGVHALRGELIDEAAARETVIGVPVFGQVGGWADQVQDDVLVECAHVAGRLPDDDAGWDRADHLAHDWELLVTVECDETPWGAQQALFVCTPRGDVAAGRLDRAEAVLQRG